MSSLLLEKEAGKNWTDFYDHFKPKSFDTSRIVIPYSTHSEKFIYTGGEKIPFNQRDSEFQLILRKEFVHVIKEIA